MKNSIRLLAATSVLLLTALSAHAVDSYVNATVGGVLRPGVYGRIEVGSAAPLPVMHPHPVIISQPVVVTPVQPVYLYVPPGHQKHWAKHCTRYNACGQHVYFVNMAKYQKHHGHHGHHGHYMPHRREHRN